MRSAQICFGFRGGLGFAAFRSRIVAYLMVGQSQRSGGVLDFETVWRSQAVSAELEDLLRAWATGVARRGPAEHRDNRIVYEDENNASLGRSGHATRYYAVLIRSLRKPPSETGLQRLLNED